MYMTNNGQENSGTPDSSPKGLVRLMTNLKRSFADLLPTPKSKDLGGYFVFYEQEQSATISVAPGQKIDVSFDGSYGDFHFALLLTNESTTLAYNRQGMRADTNLDVLLCQLVDSAGTVVREGVLPLEYYNGSTDLEVAGRRVARIGSTIENNRQSFEFKTRRGINQDEPSDFGFEGRIDSVSKDHNGRTMWFTIKLAPTMSAKFRNDLDQKQAPV